MNLAYGYVAETLQTHDELTAARVNEQRRLAAERLADESERALVDGRPGLRHRLGERLHGRGAHGAHAGAGARSAHGLRAAH